MSETPRPAAAIVLAAGEGTRMRSTRPKVLFSLLGRSLLGHVLAAVRALDPQELVVVTGHRRAEVEAHLAEIDPAAKPVYQTEQRGTGHAVRVALEALDAERRAAGRPTLTGTILVTAADTPLLTSRSLAAMVAHREQTGVAGVLLTATMPDPTGYGRVLRDDSGRVRGIVEERDADPAHREIREVNAGVYAFDAAKVRAALARLTTDNAQGEEYLTDVVRIFGTEGEPVAAAILDDWREILGVNDRAQLAVAAALLRDRKNTALMRAGVTIMDPATTWIDVDVDVAPEAEIWPNTILAGTTRVAASARIGPNCHLIDTEVGERARVRDATCENAQIGPDAEVGPYTYLRPGTRLGRGAKAGGFVEMKNAVVGAESKVPHLSYVGDATIGERTNVGAATVFVNYDGVAKHHSVVGNDVRIGSDTMIVAPVTIGDGAYTAAGSVIVEDVPPGALAIARARQQNIEGWVVRKRPGTRAAEAAKQASPTGGLPVTGGTPDHDGRSAAGGTSGRDAGDDASC